MFVLELRNTQFFRWHLGYCLPCKTTKLLHTAIGTINALAVWRELCLCVYGYLVVPSRNEHDPRSSFLS